MRFLHAAFFGFYLSLFLCTPALAQNPSADYLQSEALTQQAVQAAKQKKNGEAQTLFTRATELNTKNGEAWTGLGRLTYVMGDPAKAKSFLQEGWACGDAGGLRTLAALALLEGDNPAFQELLPDLMKQKDSNVEIRAMLVLYYNKIGRMTAAQMEPVMAGMNLTQLNTVSKENLKLLLQAYEVLGRAREAQTIQTELNKRPSSR